MSDRTSILRARAPRSGRRSASSRSTGGGTGSGAPSSPSQRSVARTHRSCASRPGATAIATRPEPAPAGCSCSPPSSSAIACSRRPGAHAGRPGRSWRVWLSTNGGPRKVWLAKTSAWTGGIVLPRTAREACVTAATAGAAPSPPACSAEQRPRPVGALLPRARARRAPVRLLAVCRRRDGRRVHAPADARRWRGRRRRRDRGSGRPRARAQRQRPVRELAVCRRPESAALHVEAWARANGGAGTARKVLVERDPAGLRGLILEATAKDNWKAWLGHGSKSWDAITGPGVVRGRWTHLVLAYDGASATLYVDGAKAGSCSRPSDRTTPVRSGSASAALLPAHRRFSSTDCSTTSPSTRTP